MNNSTSGDEDKKDTINQFNTELQRDISNNNLEAKEEHFRSYHLKNVYSRNRIITTSIV
jgi:hypothetical protein